MLFHGAPCTMSCAFRLFPCPLLMLLMYLLDGKRRWRAKARKQGTGSEAQRAQPRISPVRRYVPPVYHPHIPPLSRTQRNDMMSMDRSTADSAAGIGGQASPKRSAAFSIDRSINQPQRSKTLSMQGIHRRLKKKRRNAVNGCEYVCAGP